MQCKCMHYFLYTIVFDNKTIKKIRKRLRKRIGIAIFAAMIMCFCYNETA